MSTNSFHALASSNSRGSILSPLSFSHELGIITTQLHRFRSPICFWLDFCTCFERSEKCARTCNRSTHRDEYLSCQEEFRRTHKWTLPNLYLALRLASIPWRRDNLSSRPVFRDGQPVESREAVARRNELIERLASLPPVPGALDQIVQRFGTDLVAEVTGRSRRVVRKGGRPLPPLDRVFRRETMSSVSSMIRRAASTNSWPAGVSRVPPLVRSE